MECGENTFMHVRQKLVMSRIGFMAQLARFSSRELTQKNKYSQWTPLQTVYHLYLIDGLMLEQMRRVQAEDNPVLENIAQKATSALQKYRSALPSLEALLSRMVEQRQALFRYLAALHEEDWESLFHHPQWGEHTLLQLALTLPLYDQQHAQRLATCNGEDDYHF